MKKFMLVFLILGTFLYSQADTVLDSSELTKHKVGLEENNEQENIGFKWVSVYSVLVYLGLISIMIFLYLRYKKRSVIYTVTDDQLKTDTENSKVNWNNFFNKVSQQPEAERLYKKLIRLAHPDRFPNDKNKIQIANEITALLGKYKLDLSKLKRLKLRINKELLNNV